MGSRASCDGKTNYNKYNSSFDGRGTFLEVLRSALFQLRQDLQNVTQSYE